MEYRNTIIIANNLNKISTLLISGTYFINNANPIKLPMIGNTIHIYKLIILYSMI